MFIRTPQNVERKESRTNINKNISFAFLLLGLIIVITGCRGKYLPVFQSVPREPSHAPLPTIVIDQPVLEREQYTIFKDATNPTKHYFVPQRLTIQPASNAGRQQAIAWKRGKELVIGIPFAFSAGAYSEATDTLKGLRPTATLEPLTFPDATLRLIGPTGENIADEMHISFEISNPRTSPFNGLVFLTTTKRSGSKILKELIKIDPAILLEYKVSVMSVTQLDPAPKLRAFTVSVQLGNMSVDKEQTSKP